MNQQINRLRWAGSQSKNLLRPRFVIGVTGSNLLAVMGFATSIFTVAIRDIQSSLLTLKQTVMRHSMPEIAT